jgi:hypothetical protein
LQNRRLHAFALLLPLWTACVYGPPLRGRQAPPDNAPFYFPTGIDPSPFEPVLMDLSAGDSRSFGLQVFDTDPDDVLRYTWTLTIPDLAIAPILAQGELGAGSPLSTIASWQVPGIQFQTCQGALLNLLSEAGDEVALELTITDEIPEDQRFDDSATAYEIVVRWNLVAVGQCP